eukprot:4450246-Alexandrium_andersonii.AAC.1
MCIRDRACSPRGRLQTRACRCHRLRRRARGAPARNMHIQAHARAGAGADTHRQHKDRCERRPP